MDQQKIIDATEKLSKNIVYAMSLGSKELFHSNVWGWLFGHNARYVQVFFSEINEECEVYRENKNRDIMISCQGKEYVIENKLKSLPNKKQLIDYTNKSSNFERGILTGIIDPKFDIDKWSFVSYQQIINEFRVINNDEKDNNIKINVDMYLDSLQQIYDILHEIDNVGELPHWLNDIAPTLKKIRIWDLCQKYMAVCFYAYLNTQEDYIRLKDKINNIDDRFFLYEGISYHNDKVTSDFRIVNKDGKETYSTWYGIQIEEDQLRRMIDIHPQGIEKINGYDASISYNENLFNIFRNCGWFYDYDSKSKKLNEKPTKMSKPFDKYGDHTVYQYYVIEDFSFKNVKDILIYELNTAIEYFKLFKDDMSINSD